MKYLAYYSLILFSLGTNSALADQSDFDSGFAAGYSAGYAAGSNGVQERYHAILGNSEMFPVFPEWLSQIEKKGGKPSYLAIQATPQADGSATAASIAVPIFGGFDFSKEADWQNLVGRAEEFGWKKEKNTSITIVPVEPFLKGSTELSINMLGKNSETAIQWTGNTSIYFEALRGVSVPQSGLAVIPKAAFRD